LGDIAARGKDEWAGAPHGRIDNITITLRLLGTAPDYLTGSYPEPTLKFGFELNACKKTEILIMLESAQSCTMVPYRKNIPLHSLRCRLYLRQLFQGRPVRLNKAVNYNHK